MASSTLAFAFVGHLVGDYLLQNDWQAQGKKVSTPICAIHCALWTLAVLAFSGWWIWWVPIVLFVTHFAQDRGPLVRQYMHLIGQDKFAAMSPDGMGPWSIVAVDNVFHLVVLAVVAMVLK